MKLESKAPLKGDIFKRVKRLTLIAQSEEDETFLSDLHRILLAGSTTRREFARSVAAFRASLDTPGKTPKES